MIHTYIKEIKLIERKRRKEKRMIRINSRWNRNTLSVKRLKKSRANVPRRAKISFVTIVSIFAASRIISINDACTSPDTARSKRASVWESNSRRACGPRPKKNIHRVRRDKEESGDRQSAKSLVSWYKQSQFPASVRAAGKDFARATTKRQYSALESRDRVGVGSYVG